MMMFTFVILTVTTITMDTLVTTTVTTRLNILVTKQYLKGRLRPPFFLPYWLALISVDDNPSNSCLPRNTILSFEAIVLRGPATASRSSSSSSLEDT